MEKAPESCAEILALLSDYLDLALPPDACQEVEHHLAGCSPCDEFAASLRKTVALCRTFSPRAMPAPLSREARTELEQAWKKMLEARNAMDANISDPPTS